MILATNEDRDNSASSATQVSTPSPTGNTRYDGGPEDGSRGATPASQSGVRYDGGPEEGTAALTQRATPATSDSTSIKSQPAARYDGGPRGRQQGLGEAQHLAPKEDQRALRIGGPAGCTPPPDEQSLYDEGGHASASRRPAGVSTGAGLALASDEVRACRLTIGSRSLGQPMEPGGTSTPFPSWAELSSVQPGGCEQGVELCFA